ncbi:MAP7 domain-containing protein [Sphingobacterium faecale]|uniref:Uncharacterized protein n=1 Tax=Sphingobacterium faecale TaxID=2803775 RepID=A0ABS1R5G9_9SPHI|nr:MAP7 domain-containing protein [Sphingobacterium faecale]MBL1409799.1 hypothetical protein [Sphingobacterium faecale]
MKNNTGDDLGIKLSVTVHLTCGSSFSYNAGIDGVINLAGGKQTDANFFFDTNGMSKEAVKEYERLCGKRKKGQKTVISGISCSLISVVNYSQQKRDEQAKREKEEAERKRLAEEKARKEAELKKQKEEEQKRLANEKAKQEAENQRLAEENRRKQTASDQSANGSARTETTVSRSSKTEEPRKDFVLGNVSVEQYRNYPEEFKTNDGKYIKKDNGHLVYISEQEYNQRKYEHKANLERQGEQARARLLEEQNRKAQATIDNIRRQEQERVARNERSDAYMQQASYYGAQASFAKEMRIEASSFQQTHTNLASLEAEYSAKLRQLSASAATEQQATSAAYASAAASIAEAGWGNSELSQSAGQLGAAIGGLIASSRADKARKELAEERKRQAEDIAKAMAKAKKEHEEAEQKLKAEAERLRKEAIREGIINLRKQLAQTFVDGGTPLQKHNITQPEVYLFAYSSSKNDWKNANSSSILVSNIIPIYKMSDDTFPYKNVVLKTLSSLGNVDDITLIGFFTDKTEIEEIRKNFISSVQKAEFMVKTVDIKVKENRNINKPISNDNDFWETGQTPVKTNQTNSQTSFWD